MNVLLIDDHPLVRSALEAVLLAMDDQADVQGATTAQAAREVLAHGPQPDLVLLDLNLPDVTGLSFLVELRRSHPSLPVVVISSSEYPADVVRALDEGAMGFVPKRSSTELLGHALRMVLAGGIYVPPMALQGSKDHAMAVGEPQEALSAASWGVAARPAMRRPLPSQRGLSELRLTPRQTEVLELLLQGQPNKLIARELSLSVETVKDHVASLLRVLGVSSRTQAVLAVSHLVAPTGLSAGR